MRGSQQVARSWGAWPLAVVLAVGAGCGAEERTGPELEKVQPTASTGTPSTEDCQVRVDRQIEADVIPRADRDYAMDMCEALPQGG